MKDIPPSCTPGVLLAVDMVSATNGWAVGENGTLLRYSDPITSLTINHSSRPPGSFFMLSGANFLANSVATININGFTLGMLTTDSSGNFIFILDTSQADEGTYTVTATVNPSATAIFTLDADQPLRLQEDIGDLFIVPEGIIFQPHFLPMVTK